jgi:phosphinothricin acetyltransferase
VDIRPAAAADLEGIVAIYNHYVAHSYATFDDQPVQIADRKAWFESFRPTGPHRLVVADDGVIAGYAASMPYRSGPAFAETVELSIYLAPSHTGRGVGTRLFEWLLSELSSEPVHRAVVGIAIPNDASVQLHRRFGFEEVGTFDEYATKWGHRVSSLWMQLRLTP